MKPYLGASCLFLVALVSGCNREHKRVIAVIPKGNADLFWQSVHAGAAKAGKETDVNVVWNGPASEADYTVQLQIVDAMINRHVDAIALAPTDRQALVKVVERAANSNVPVVIFDSAIDTQRFVSQVATDNYKAGQMAGERLGKILDGKGKVVIVAVKPGAASTEAREKGFEDVMQQKFPGIRILDKRYGMAVVAQAMTVSENMLTAHPDLDGIFASNESSTIGAAQALRGRLGKIKLVGFDWSPTLLDDLKSGIVDSLVIQDPFKMGYQAVMAAVKHLQGEPVTKIVDLAPRLIERQNLNTPDVQAQLHPDLKYLE
ncbi:MAG TPA: substrate-binding domain-containing protein [Bryobacteraceae bacterium]|jgi:ribose transport system substrate-binding protein|nr:substrate-binding domain-containing protein [Bryobacteraceae bacterium]